MVIILRKTCAGNINLFLVMVPKRYVPLSNHSYYHILSDGGLHDQLSLVAPVLIAILSPSQVFPHSHV